MAETKKCNKIVAIPGYIRKQYGKKIVVPEHRRSTLGTSTGKKYVVRSRGRLAEPPRGHRKRAIPGCESLIS